MNNEWEAGATPWLRRHQPETTWSMENSVQCMFCGEQTLRRSASDREQDPGRLELHCDNQHCDALEMVLLVKRDRAEATSRADVRALHLLDEGTLDVHAAFPPEASSHSMADLIDLIADRYNVVERRMRKARPAEN